MTVGDVNNKTTSGTAKGSATNVDKEIARRLNKAREVAKLLSKEGLDKAIGKIAMTSDVEYDEYVALMHPPSWFEVIEKAYSSIVPGAYLIVVDIKSLNLILTQVLKVTKLTFYPSSGGDARYEGEDVIEDIIVAPISIKLKPIMLINVGKELLKNESLSYEDLLKLIESSERLSLPIPPDPGSPVVIPKPEILGNLLSPQKGPVLGAMAIIDVPLGPDPVPITIPWEALLKHVLVVGTTGAGKTSFIKNFLYHIYRITMEEVKKEEENKSSGEERTINRRFFFALDSNQDFVVMNFPGFVPKIRKREEIGLKSYGFKQFAGNKLPTLIVLPSNADSLLKSMSSPTSDLVKYVEDYVRDLAKSMNAAYSRIDAPYSVDESNIHINTKYWNDYKVLEVTVSMEENEKEGELSLYVAPRAIVLKEISSVPAYYPGFTEKATEALRRVASSLNIPRPYPLNKTNVEIVISEIVRNRSLSNVHQATINNLISNLRAVANSNIVIIDGRGDFDVFDEQMLLFMRDKKLGGLALELSWNAYDDNRNRMIATRFLNKFADMMSRSEYARWIKSGIVVIDEAHTYFPKSEEASSFAHMLSSTLNRLARLGRSRGISLLFSTHRPNDVTPVVQTLTNTKIYFRVDKRLVEELEVEKQYKDRLPFFEDYAAVVSSYVYRGGFMSFVSGPAVVGHRTA